MDIESVKELLKENKIRFKEHSIKRLRERNIKILDIISGIKNGKIK